MIRAALRRLLYWLAPSIELGDRAFVEAATLRADFAALSLRLRVVEHSLAEWQRQARETTAIALAASREVAWLSTRDQGSLSARVALLEMTLLPPVYDGPAADGRLDKALEDALRHEADKGGGA